MGELETYDYNRFVFRWYREWDSYRVTGIEGPIWGKGGDGFEEAVWWVFWDLREVEELDRTKLIVKVYWFGEWESGRTFSRTTSGGAAISILVVRQGMMSCSRVTLRSRDEAEGERITWQYIMSFFQSREV